MLLIKLAVRNILGAGLRTWLNVAALSFSYVAIIFLQGVYTGMNDQVERATIDAVYGGGQFWQKNYDPYDPLTINDAHGVIPAPIQQEIANGNAAPILIRQAAIYPNGRFRTVLLKGIDQKQSVVTIPSALLQDTVGKIPAIIGGRMAKSIGAKKGDVLAVQWRDSHGTFDARDVEIVEIMQTTVQEIDNNQIWIPIHLLQRFTSLPDNATIIIVKSGIQIPQNISDWNFKDLNFLLKEIHQMVKQKRIGGSIFYIVLLLLALLAIFDTQVLSIFKRRKEMGTLMALGMTRRMLIALFTVEGAFHGILAALAAAVYGIPLLAYVAEAGWKLPQATDSVGFAIGEKLFPVFSIGLITGTILLVLLVTTIVSFLPTKKIAKLKPTDALRGKIS